MRRCLSRLDRNYRCLQQSKIYTTARNSKFQNERKFTRYAGMAVFSTIAGGTALLGAWQTRRYLWKADLIRDREKRLHEEAIDLPEHAVACTNIDDLEYHQLHVEGTYKADSTLYLYPRSSPAEASDSVANPQSGGYMYSLLIRPSGTPVIVNRGWLPQKYLLQHIPNENEEGGKVTSFIGVLRHGEKPGAFTPENDLMNRHLYWLDHKSMAEAMGANDVLPVIVDALEESGENEGISKHKLLRPKLHNYTTFYMTPEKHAGYAITWYSISVAAAIFGYLRFRKLKVKHIL